MEVNVIKMDELSERVAIEKTVCLTRQHDSLGLKSPVCSRDPPLKCRAAGKLTGL